MKGDLRLAQQVERDDDVIDELFSRAKKELESRSYAARRIAESRLLIT